MKTSKPAVLFDMDGVIIHNSDFHVRAWTEFAREYGRELTPDEVKMLLGSTNAEYMRFVLGRTPSATEVSDAVTRKEALYREIYAPHLRAPEGLLALFDAIAASGVSMGIATGAPQANIDFTLDGLGIRHYFEQIADASQVAHGKPAPDTYLLAASKLGADPRSCVVIEDAIAGVNSGKAAGMKVIAITSSYPAKILRQHCSPDAIIDSFLDLRYDTSAALAILREICGCVFTLGNP